MAVKLRVYFRNIVLFVQRRDGTDAWFVDTHTAAVFTAARTRTLHKNVVKILTAGSPLVDHPTTVMNRSLFGDFKGLYSNVALHDDVKNRRITDKHIVHVELRGVGILKALPSAHSHGALLDWTIPKSGGGEIIQRMTEVSVYEVDGVSTPVEVAVVDQAGRVEKLEVPELKDHEGKSVAEIFFVAGEKPPRVLSDDDYELEEFTHMLECFDATSKGALTKSIPKATRPTGTPPLFSAEPFCPEGIVDFSSI